MNAPAKGVAPLLEVRNLRVRFESAGETAARAVEGVSFTLARGETLGLVGESGCGKSLTALSIPRLVDEPPAQTSADSSILFRGEELVGASQQRLRQLRGAEIGFVFQEPMTSLNPVHRVGDQVAEALWTRGDVSRKQAKTIALELLDRVEFRDPRRAMRAYPHELSGGMRQRALIAMAVACEPSLLIADEPTTALDVTVQAQILELLASLQADTGLALLLISHDLAVVSQVADRVAVMYAGRIVETGTARQVFGSPRHPYTEGLLRAVPTIDGAGGSLAMIPGRVPRPDAWPSGCTFHPRCPYAWDRCETDEPDLLEAATSSGWVGARCWLEDEPAKRSGTGYAEVDS